MKIVKVCAHKNSVNSTHDTECLFTKNLDISLIGYFYKYKAKRGRVQLEFRSCINYLLTVAHREVKQQLAARLKEYNLTPGQYGILNYLWEHEQATPKELSQTLMESTPVISALLDRLQKQGLIERRVDAEDRRSIQVSLTEEGLNLKQGVLNMVDDLNIASMERVDPEKREVLLDCLRQLSSIE